MDPITFINEFKKGSNEAFKIAFNEITPDLIGWLSVVTSKSEDDIHDIVAECWYKVFLKREQFNDYLHIRKFCYITCKYEERTKSRKWNLEQKTILGLIAVLDTEILPEKEERFEKLLPYAIDEINNIKGTTGEVIRMSLVANMSPASIADKLKIKVHTYYQYKMIALQKIKERLLSIEHLLGC